MIRVVWRVLLAIALVAPSMAPAAGVAAQEEEPTAATAAAIFEEMTVLERVGQLFVVTFNGDAAPAESSIADLIVNYHVGGVVLLAANSNITGPQNTPAQVAALTNDLQRFALFGASAATGDDDRPSSPAAQGDVTPLPLLVAVSHEGDGYPHTQILNGLTEVPSAMAIGATWQPSYAQNIGQIVGQELSALGINVLLGPSLDVLENPIPAGAGDMGTRAFGGDPYWVGLMGQAYTTGVHLGSNNRLAVIARHFPGYGSGDRPIGEEVATVRKSFEELRQIDLAPFFAVTGNAPAAEATADGLLTSHIRYQGFQGNIRAATAPVSFDPQALGQLLGLPEFAGWRQRGGLIVSDALGARAVERFYDPTEQEFPHRRVARDALLAGNDLLYVAGFALGDGNDEAHLANVRDTITWFADHYQNDLSFQQRVDEAVLRILPLKLKLYGGDFRPANVLVDVAAAAERVGQDNAAVFDLAQAAVTLIAPSQRELVERLPSPPGPADNIVIFSDVRQAQQCGPCPAQPLIGVEALEQRMVALYGPEASGQVREEQISSFAFADLKQFLAAGPGPITLPPTPTATPTATPAAEDITPEPTATPAPTATPPTPYLVQNALLAADWIIFAALDSVAAAPNSDALNLFLAQRPDLADNARVIVFAYNAPYYLDTTEISKVTAFFGIYSKSGPFIDASVRALFLESPLRGAPPVSVRGIDYDLFTVTQPNPEQVIELFVIQDGVPQSPPGAEPLEVVVGDTLHLQTGVIRDMNGNPVPDNTIVQFIRQDRLEGFFTVIAERPTVGGVAQLDYLLEAQRGQFRITAAAGEARASHEVDIVVDDNVVVSLLTPTPQPTATPTQTPTATVTPSPTATSTATPRPTAAAPTEPPADALVSSAEVQHLLGLVLGLLITGGLGWTAARNGHARPAEQLRVLLWAVIGALVFYNYFALGLPGVVWLERLHSWGGLVTAIIGGLVGLGLHGWFRSKL